MSEESQAWMDFSLTHPGWQVRWNEATGTPLRMYGRGLNYGPLTTRPQAEMAARSFLDEAEDLLQVSPLDLQLVTNETRGPLHFVTFQRQVRGIPVEGALVELFFKYGNLVMVGLDSHPGASDTATTPRLGAAQALQAAREGLGEARVVDPGQLVILPLMGTEGLSYNLAWKSHLSVDGTHRGEWITYVDAWNGAILYRYDDTRYGFTGTITGGYEERTIGGAIKSTPLVGSVVSANKALTSTTDASGKYNITTRATAATLSSKLVGPFVRVNNDVGAEGVGTIAATSSAPANFNWGYGTTGLMSETNTYYHTQVVRNRCLQITPDLPELQNVMQVNVNIADSCNAFYNGRSINFFQESADCNDTGRISDVIFHEYGHHYHSSLVVTGSVDGSVGEGSGDYLAATITGDPEIGPGFFKTGAGIRNLAPDVVYPDDLVGEVHADGLIWGGAMWDIRTRLMAERGAAAGISEADHLFATALMSGPSLATAYEAVLLADDNDGDLENGTPNLCLIASEMGHHGLGPGVRANFVHTDSPQAEPGIPLSLRVEISSSFSSCLRLDTSTASIVWSTNPEGPFKEAKLTSTDGINFAGQIPAQPAGTLVYYTFAIADEDQNDYLADGGRSYALYQTWVGPLTDVFCEDFEISDGKYVHNLDEGVVEEGADDWMWGSPIGASGDASWAASGTRVWGNDLAPDGFNGAYKPLKVNHLESRRYDTRGLSNIMLRYRRWLNVEDGANDQALITVNDVVFWQNEATESGTAHTQDNRWVWHYVPLDGAADNQASVVIRWELASNESIEFGGWNIDDVCLVAY